MGRLNIAGCCHHIVKSLVLLTCSFVLTVRVVSFIPKRDPCVFPKGEAAPACCLDGERVMRNTSDDAPVINSILLYRSPCAWVLYFYLILLLLRSWSKRPTFRRVIWTELLQSLLHHQRPNSQRASDHRMTPPTTLPTIPRAATHCLYRTSLRN